MAAHVLAPAVHCTKDPGSAPVDLGRAAAAVAGYFCRWTCQGVSHADHSGTARPTRFRGDTVVWCIQSFRVTASVAVLLPLLLHGAFC